MKNNNYIITVLTIFFAMIVVALIYSYLGFDSEQVTALDNRANSCAAMAAGFGDLYEESNLDFGSFAGDLDDYFNGHISDYIYTSNVDIYAARKNQREVDFQRLLDLHSSDCVGE